MKLSAGRSRLWPSAATARRDGNAASIASVAVTWNSSAGTVEVTQPVGAQPHGPNPWHLTGRPYRVERREHLAAVAGADDASRLMQRERDVVAVSWMGDAGVQAHANADDCVDRPRHGAQLRLRVNSGFERRRGGAEGDEQRIPLRLEVDTAVPRDGGAQHVEMQIQQRRPPLPESPEQAGGALDVGQQERDQASGKCRWPAIGSADMAGQGLNGRGRRPEQTNRSDAADTLAARSAERRHSAMLPSSPRKTTLTMPSPCDSIATIVTSPAETRPRTRRPGRSS